MKENAYYDVVIVGGGILGTSLAYWLSALYDGKRVALLEGEHRLGQHMSGRNTGVLHRPFYLHPQKKKKFAQAALHSYPLWRKLAKEYHLPWKQVGTLEVATETDATKKLETYAAWAIDNGMDDDEIELLAEFDIKKIEPYVSAQLGLLIKTDTAVDFGVFTETLGSIAKENGVRLMLGKKVKKIIREDTFLSLLCEDGSLLRTQLLINCAGGSALPIAQQCGAAREFASMEFRGEYWRVDLHAAYLARRNIYSVPRFSNFPFLDPHWIVRAYGSPEIGPNAVPVFGEHTYEGIIGNREEFVKKLFREPIGNKLKVFLNPEFLRLAKSEWRGSFSKNALVEKMRVFLPRLTPDLLVSRGRAGVRSMLLNSSGEFVNEAIEIFEPSSLHVLNYNSPGATGAPAYAAHLVHRLRERGALEHLAKARGEKTTLWDFEALERVALPLA